MCVETYYLILNVLILWSESRRPHPKSDLWVEGYYNIIVKRQWRAELLLYLTLAICRNT